MAANKSVIVLTPNGRRQTVKVTPNTTILQILEEVCKKHGFEESEYDLKHHNTILDTTAVIRFCGLPNNAQLELLPATKTRLESDVVLGVHLENGSRLLGNFTPNQTVMDVLKKLCPNEASLDTNPVVIYMRREIFGEQLEKTTLKTLGITNGRAMLRLLHREPDELHTQANVSAPLPSKPVVEKPYIRTFKKLDSPEREAPEPANITHKQDDKRDFKRSPSPMKSEPAKKKENHINQYLKEEKRKQIDKSHPVVTIKTNEDMEVDDNQLQENMDVVSDNKRCDENCEQEFVFLGERSAMLFSLETAQNIPSEDLPDDFFELTINDAKRILKDIKQRRYELENSNLTTSTMKKLEESKKQLLQLNRYKKSIIRVQFPDRTVLQGIFTPTETVGDVIHFVRDYLETKSMDFYLYTTPPKTILSKDNRLFEIGCVPGAVLHFGTHTGPAKNYLRNDLLDKFTLNSVASLAAMKLRKQATRPVKPSNDEFDEIVDNDVNIGASTSKAAEVTYEDYPSKSSSSSKPAEKLPKWFKMSK